MFETEFKQPDIGQNSLGDNDIIYTLRTAQQSQTQINMMADQKANIIIAASLIFVSVAQSIVTRDGFSATLFFWPLVVFGTMMMNACILSFLAVLPNLKPSNCMAAEELTSPFFFGQFTQVTEDDYVDHMMEKLNNNQAAREALLHQIYQLGHVLRRKYRFLRYSYLSVTGGFILAMAILLINLVASGLTG